MSVQCVRHTMDIVLMDQSIDALGVSLYIYSKTKQSMDISNILTGNFTRRIWPIFYL